MINQLVSQFRIMQNGNAGIRHIYEVLESTTDYHIVQEYLEGGDLEEKRINVLGYFDEMRCAEIVEQILQVLSHLNDKKVIHRNLCPANIMFYSALNNDFSIKI
jgi:serine/threonine protein kinase